MALHAPHAIVTVTPASAYPRGVGELGLFADSDVTWIEVRGHPDQAVQTLAGMRRRLAWLWRMRRTLPHPIDPLQLADLTTRYDEMASRIDHERDMQPRHSPERHRADDRMRRELVDNWWARFYADQRRSAQPHNVFIQRTQQRIASDRVAIERLLDRLLPQRTSARTTLH